MNLAIEALIAQHPDKENVIKALAKQSTNYRFTELLLQQPTTPNKYRERIDLIAQVLEELKISIASAKEAKKIAMQVYDKNIKTLENSLENLTKSLIDFKEAGGVIGTKLAGNNYYISYKKTPPKCEVFDPKELPADYQITETSTKANKKAIINAWKNGEIVPGTEVSQNLSIILRPLTANAAIETEE